MAEFRGNRGVTRFVIASACVVVAVIAVAACSSSSGATSNASSLAAQCPATPDVCSTGTPYATFGGIPIDEVEGDAGASCGTCTAHCGATMVVQEGTPDKEYTLAAAPSGTCGTEGEACTMTGLLNELVCSDGTSSTCAPSDVRCTCVNGSWSCFVTSLGKSACPSCSSGAN